MGLGLVKVNCAKNSNLCATTLCPIALVSAMHCLAEPGYEPRFSFALGHKLSWNFPEIGGPERLGLIPQTLSAQISLPI
jgi:hypothetical protein